MGKRQSRHAPLFGILLLALGFAGFFLPNLMSLATDVSIGYLLLLGGVSWGLHSISNGPAYVSNWLKPAVLAGSGLLMLSYPKAGIEAMAMVLAIYLLLDAAGSSILAFIWRPAPGWVWMLSNGLISLMLAAMILSGWPAISAWIVGLYVGISLASDGISLLAVYFSTKRLALN